MISLVVLALFFHGLQLLAVTPNAGISLAIVRARPSLFQKGTTNPSLLKVALVHLIIININAKVA